MAAYLGLVPNAAQGLANELTTSRLGNRFAKGSLADPRRANEAQYWPLQLVRPRLHRKIFDDPVLNLFQGEVVGINTAVARSDANSAANNVGFSIAVDEIVPVLEQLRSQAGGQVREEGFLGVGLAARTDGGQGAIISSVQPNSPASLAGIRENDIVLSVDGEPIDGQAGLVAAIRDASPGQTVEIELLRDGKRMTVKAKLVARTGD